MVLNEIRNEGAESKKYLTSLLNACEPYILFTKLMKVDNQISKDYRRK